MDYILWYLLISILWVIGVFVVKKAKSLNNTDNNQYIKDSINHIDSFLDNAGNSKPKYINNETIYDYLDIFRLASTAFIPESWLAQTKNYTKANIYLFGATDFLCQQINKNEMETIAIFTTMLINIYDDTKESSAIIKDILDNSNDEAYQYYQTLGFNTMKKWINGDNKSLFALGGIYKPA